jgi:probable HAF family extracellular repeat protein
VLKDLGTLGGNKSTPRWINDAGEIVGRADLYPGSITRHGFLWKKGVMTDLGVVGRDPCSTAFAINSREQIVGTSGKCGKSWHGFLWENRGPIVDLQTLVLPGSDVTIKATYLINNAGEISGSGTNSNGDQRGILLIPCDSDHPGVEGCDHDPSDLDSSAASARANSASSTTTANQPPTASKFARRIPN